MKIAILLATHNGQAFLPDLLSSLGTCAPYEHTVRIVCSDDASTDRSIELLRAFDGYNQIAVNVIDSGRKGGAVKNFAYLVKHCATDFDLYFFCDQDDFWLPDKMDAVVRRFENERMLDIPLLFHSDLCLTDERLVPTAISMFKYQKLNANPDLQALLLQNSITGCSMALNRSALLLLRTSSLEKSIMHDWYAGMVVAAFGKIVHLPQSLILYRQHASNQVGAKQLSVWKSLLSGRIAEEISRSFSSIESTFHQAKLFLSDFGPRLTPQQFKTVHAYVSSFDEGPSQRARLFFFRGFRKYGWERNLVYFFLYVFFAKRIAKR